MLSKDTIIFMVVSNEEIEVFSEGKKDECPKIIKLYIREDGEVRVCKC